MKSRRAWKRLLILVTLLSIGCTKEVIVEKIVEVPVEDLTRINELSRQINDLQGDNQGLRAQISALMDQLDTSYTQEDINALEMEIRRLETIIEQLKEPIQVFVDDITGFDPLVAWPHGASVIYDFENTATASYELTKLTEELNDWEDYIKANSRVDDTGIHFSSSETNFAYFYSQDRWMWINERPFFNDVFDPAQDIADNGKLLYITANKNSSDLHSDESYQSVSERLAPEYWVSPVLFDYMLHQKVGADKILRSGHIDLDSPFGGAAVWVGISSDGIYNQHTILVESGSGAIYDGQPSSSIVPSSTSRSTPVLAGYATDILQTDPAMNPGELKALMLSLCRIVEAKQWKGEVDESGNNIFVPFTAKVLTREIVDNYLQQN